jgi:predicted RNase H-like HicB family nuclease
MEQVLQDICTINLYIMDIRKTGKLGTEVYIEDEKLGGYTVYFEDFPNIVSQGETFEEAEQNLWNTLFDVLKYLLEKDKTKKSN